MGLRVMTFGVLYDFTGNSNASQITKGAALVNQTWFQNTINPANFKVDLFLVIGHNPTMAYVAELVDDGEGDDDATTALVTRGFPTSALAVFAVDGPWSDLGPGAGRLVAFHVGGA